MAVRRMLVAGRYRLREPVGTGGMGRVWLARDEMLDRDVAVKEFVPPEWMTDEEKSRLKDRTLREARSAARLNHPNVVQIYDVVHADGQPWIVMEYVPSRSLHQVLSEDGPFVPSAAARIGLQVLDALTAAHRAGVLHRDIKPHNVLIGEDGRVVLTDFGLATFVDDGSVTGPGLIVGSPQYVSPERARDGASTVESDLWSFGATLYAAVEGRSPYARESAMATLMALATEPPDRPEQAGLLAPVLTGLLRREPEARLTTVEVDRRLRMIVAAAETAEAGREAMHNGSVVNGAGSVAAPRPAPTTNGHAEVATMPGETAAPALRRVNHAAVRALPAQRTSAGPVSPGPVSSGSAAPGPGSSGPTPPGSGSSGSGSSGSDSSGPSAPEPDSSELLSSAPVSPVSQVSPVSPGVVYTSPAADLTRSRSRFPRRAVIVAALTAMAILGAGGIVAAYLVGRDDPATRVALPAGTSAAAPAPSAAASAAAGSSPGGFTPAACNGPVPSQAPRTPQKGASREVAGYSIYPGWSYFTDGTGFHLPVPDRWSYQKFGTTYCFHDPSGERMMILDVGRRPTADPVAACRQEAKRVAATHVLPGYKLVTLESRPLLDKAADWEYTYRAPDGTPMYVQTQWQATKGKAFAIAWATPQAEWPSDFAKFSMALSSFYVEGK
jgi:serine/threonine protein kinase